MDYIMGLSLYNCLVVTLFSLHQPRWASFKKADINGGLPEDSPCDFEIMYHC
jgi:hypothetical protein